MVRTDRITAAKLRLTWGPARQVRLSYHKKWTPCYLPFNPFYGSQNQVPI